MSDDSKSSALPSRAQLTAATSPPPPARPEPESDPSSSTRTPIGTTSGGSNDPKLPSRAQLTAATSPPPPERAGPARTPGEAKNAVPNAPSLPSRAQLTAATSPPAPVRASPPAPVRAEAGSDKTSTPRDPSSTTLNSDMKPLKELLPLARVDALLTQPGSPLELQHELIDGRIQPVFMSQRTTIRDLMLNSMNTFPRRTHLVYGDVRLTYAETHQQALRLANALRIEFGVRKGDRIAIISRNTPHFALTAFAAYILGAIIVPINAFAEGPMLHFCIQDADARVVVCDVERWQRIREAGLQNLVTENKSLQAIVVSPWKNDVYVPRAERDWLRRQDAGPTSEASPSSPVVVDWDDISERARAYPDLPLVHLTPEDYAMIMYTSGTTGQPKGVLSNNRQVLGALGVAAVHVTRAFLRRGQALPIPAGPEVWEEPLCPSFLSLSPLFHITGLASGLNSGTFRGSKIVFLPTYSAKRALDVIRTERVKAMSGIGFMIKEILTHAKEGDLESLESVAHGGASSANEIPAELQNKRRGVAATTGYGMTETNGLVLGAGLDEYSADPSSIGHPTPAVDVRIVDPLTLRVVTDGEPGELLIRAPCNATGYWRRPKETAEIFLTDGFVRTGDLARRDPTSGYVYIMDRIKDMIIRGGENVSCALVEGAVYGDARVAECAAVGIPDERLGERVGMIVVAHPSTSSSAPALDTTAVQAIARAKGLPKFAIPEVVWVRSEPLERNASGKLVKQNLKEEMKRWLATGGREAKL
ncbi:unnamed protein product [Tilletia controversa]|nr:unnamed protein product [Tilletia controversa]